MYSEFKINSIPALLWGEKSERLIIAVHGNLSHKADTPVKMLAENAALKGYQVLSFDLPEHGDRKSDGVPCKVQNCVEELKAVMEYARQHYNSISLFANSMGAYFSLLAYQNENIDKALFLSPVTDMRVIIENMMRCFDVSEQRLEYEREIALPIGQTLYWDYYRYVCDNPIRQWSAPTHILYGDMDDMCARDTVEDFANRFSCSMETVHSEHWFHTEEQLGYLKDWIEIKL